MPTTLVIVESPAKCKKIESYLGPGYKVMASFGHLRKIDGLQSIDINNNFYTKYSLISEELKNKQIEKIRIEISKADEVIIATDDDREGESIGWHICDLFGLSIINTKRIIFHEITESAIQSAILYPKRININLVEAQQARQILDLLVGFTISPILWNFVSKTHNSSLSAGRCQTPALRLVYENYLDIKKSPGKLVYNTFGYFTSQNLLFELNKKFDDEIPMKDFLENCKEWDFIYSVTEPKKTIKKSPEALTTSTLQQLASNELNLSPKETMKYAQQLYEGGYITYMRTDSKKYSQEFIDNIKKFITNKYGLQYISQNIDNLIVNNKFQIDSSISETEQPKKAKKTVAEKKGIPPPQEAHEAIRPVNINISNPIIEDLKIKLESKALKLYEFIWKKTVESCMPSAQFNSITAKISAPLNSEFTFKSEQVIFLGWQMISHTTKQVEEVETKYYQFLQTLKKNVSIKPTKIDSKFTMIELKSHYTEARLVQLLEEKGIGRPSTFASLIDKIQERKYVEKQNILGKEIESNDFMLVDNHISQVVSTRTFGNEKNKLVILPLGIIVIEFLLEKFDIFFNYKYTKLMEDDLDKIANGNLIWHELCNNCYNSLTCETNKLQDLKKFSIKIDENHTLIIGKHGPVVKYIDPTDNKKVSFLEVNKKLVKDNLNNVSTLTLEEVLEPLSIIKDKEPIGKYKGQDLFIKKGKFGIYAQWGKETKSLKEEFDTIEDIEYIDIIRYLEKETGLKSTTPIGLIRELNSHLSLRTGKYGDYIFYKKPRDKTPKFLKLKEFVSNSDSTKGLDARKCDKAVLLNWIKLTYNVE
jgi:DNA topoisomerase-1